MERADEASELASLAGSADTEANKPLPSHSEGPQLPVSPPLPATGGAATSGSSSPPQDSSSHNANPIDKSNMANPLIRSASVSEDYLEFLGRPGHIEKRFPVDRKKLEKLITEGGRNNETAEEFFKRVQDMTGTLVLWPSRLKIGAKSKKDPQVKVVGVASNIQQAREMILVDLDAKSTRVTLKMEVAYSEHSHVIGKEGANIKKVHSETNCHIHFPDSNRSAYGGERSNQVSITGQVDGLEAARRKIRDLLPAVVTFNLPLPAQYDSNLANSPDIQQIMQQYNVMIHLKPQHQYPHQYLVVVVRGTMKTLDGLKLAVSSLVEYYTGDIMHIPVVSLNLDIATQHYRTLIGSGGGNIRKIMAETSTTIQFPDPQSRYSSSHVTVTGDVDSVFRARELLLGCLPAVLMFDVHESDDNVLSSSLIGDLMQQLDLFISVKPKKGQLQSVIIKSIEQNIQCMYRARTSLLACSYQPVSSPQPLPPALSPRTTPPPPAIKPQLKESQSIQEKDDLKATEVFERRATEGLERRVSFKDLVEEKSLPTNKPSPLITSSTMEEVEEEVESKEEKKVVEEDEEKKASISPPLPDSRVNSTPNSSSSQQRASITPPMRPTTKQFLDWERKREQAQQAMKSKVEPDKVRYPTAKYAGNLFSESMPVATRGGPGGKTPPSPSSTPQGLSSINRTSYQALMNQATQERAQTLHSEHDQYEGVTDLGSLLQRLGLEHYESCFEQEEVDLDTFLTMTEADLKEVGVTTLGARRKLQIAISELKKKKGKTPSAASLPRTSASLPRSSASLGRASHGRNVFRSTSGSLALSPPPGPKVVGINRSASLSRDTKFTGMSRSGRF